MSEDNFDNVPDHLVSLVAFPTEFGASTVVAALAERGIRAHHVGGFTANFRAEAPGVVQVVVAEEDLQRARSALQEIQSEMDDIDWSQVDVGESE